MKRLHQIAPLLILCSSCILSLGTASAQERCSLIVRVVSPDGRRPEVPISVREKGGRVEEKEQEDTDVRFCDLGILPVTVTVGSSGLCNQVTVHNVPVAIEETY